MPEKKEKRTCKLAEKVYDDIVAPVAKPIGTIFSLLPRTIRVCLSRWETWLLDGEKTLELTAKAIQEKTALIPADNLTEPEAYVAVPAIQQLTYSYHSEELREMYANLLVSSMKKDSKYKVHPAFVDIIKQLSPDEAKLLKYLSNNPHQPLIDVELRENISGGFVVLLHNFTNIAEIVCENPGGIFSYIDNLERLKLIEIPTGICISNDEVYETLEKHPLIEDIKSKNIYENKSVKIARKKFIVTSFARDFIEVCF